MSSPPHHNQIPRKPGDPAPTLYLARSVLKRPIHYSLRLSYWDSATNCFRTCQLADLGNSPGKFICYPNDTSFHLDMDFVHHISKRCGHDCETELEVIFWPFVAPSVQRKMEHFFYRGKEQVRFQPGMKLLSIDGRPPHSFDQRRLHFLRFGSTDQGRVFRMPPRLLIKLLNRSRDELEQYFLKEESLLREDEIKSYLYAALNLQQHFTESHARSFPQALPPEKIDDAFLHELCRLNDDQEFWQERTDYSRLPLYLIRYVILFSTRTSLVSPEGSKRLRNLWMVTDSFAGPRERTRSAKMRSAPSLKNRRKPSGSLTKRHSPNSFAKRQNPSTPMQAATTKNSSASAKPIKNCFAARNSPSPPGYRTVE